ncbi:MAG: sensor histidine kinase [Ruminococcaceae bacterium]|nr:sensor histidine kinase [Oscillospiraceae bacterium]
MKELSLNILDIAKNSVVAGASLIRISLDTDEDGWLVLQIRDNGCGMNEETLRSVTDPFYTTRTTRKVGLGLPLLKLAAEQTGGTLQITSSQHGEAKGTTVKATFDTKSIDCMPIGDIISTVCILVAGSPEIDFDFSDRSPEHSVTLRTAELREILGDSISLAEPEIQNWMKEYLQEQYAG